MEANDKKEHFHRSRRDLIFPFFFFGKKKEKAFLFWLLAAGPHAARRAETSRDECEKTPGAPNPARTLPPFSLFGPGRERLLAAARLGLPSIAGRPIQRPPAACVCLLAVHRSQGANGRRGDN